MRGAMATGLAAAAYDDSGRGQARRGDGIGLAFEVYGPLAAKAKSIIVTTAASVAAAAHMAAAVP